MDQWVWALRRHSGSWSWPLDGSDFAWINSVSLLSHVSEFEEQGVSGAGAVWPWCSPGKVLRRGWGTYLELGSAIKSSSLDSRKKPNSFMSVSLLSTSPVNHSFNIQSPRTELCVGPLHGRVIFIPSAWKSQIWTLALSRKAWQQFIRILNKAIKDVIGNWSKSHRMCNRQLDDH